jgi:hypothetical protein
MQGLSHQMGVVRAGSGCNTKPKLEAYPKDATKVKVPFVETVANCMGKIS